MLKRKIPLNFLMDHGIIVKSKYKEVFAMFIKDVNEDISLRILSIRDAEALFQITDQSREHLRQWLPWVDETKTVEDSRSFIKNSFQLYADGTGLTTGIFYQEVLVGVAGFNKYDWKNRIGYIGYWLASAYQGHGIMTKTVHTLVDYAFHELELNRIDIRAAKENKRSRSIPERLGFTEEGVIRQGEWLYDHYVDHVIYGMLKREWAKVEHPPTGK